MAGATEKPGGFTRPFSLLEGMPKQRVLSEEAELKRSALPPIEVKVTDKPNSQKLDMGLYEQGTGRG